MRRIFILFALSFVTLESAIAAQYDTLFKQHEFIDIGNVRAPHSLHGNMWLDTSYVGIDFPKGSNRHTASLGALWMSGYVGIATLRTSAMTYGAQGTDYWPGPVNGIAATPQQLYDSSKKWARIWKINQTEINSFLATATHTVANTPASILEWPAKGNPYAKGNAGAALKIDLDLAPFVDVNADGQYDPLAGDYPRMKGSQMLWWIINDAGPTHTVTNGTALKVETKVCAYAYKLGTTADNIIFYEYTVTNRSTATYTNFRLGMMADFDLGFAFDDMAGFDSSRRLGVIYNHQPGSGTGTPQMAALAIMELPGDAYNAYSPAGSFVSYSNSNSSPAGDPQTAVEYDRFLRSQYRNGSTWRFGGSYIPHNETFGCDSNAMNDMRFVLASGNLSLAPSETKKYGFAVMLADSTGECPAMSFDKIHNETDTAYKLYWNPVNGTPVGGTTGILGVQRTQLRMFPNPAHNLLYIEANSKDPGNVRIYDATGRCLEAGQTQSSNRYTIDVSKLPAGIYTIRFQSNSGSESGIFVKE